MLVNIAQVLRFLSNRLPALADIRAGGCLWVLQFAPLLFKIIKRRQQRAGLQTIVAAQRPSLL